MAVYTPLFVYLSPASIPQVVANIQKYLAENPIITDEETIEELIREYIEAHPEILAVSSVNGETGNVVLTGSDININTSSAVSIETQLSNLASMIQSASGDITQIEAQLETIYTNIGTLQTNVSNNTTAIGSLQTSVTGQGTRLAAAEGDIDSLESAQTAHGTRLNTAEGNISSLQTRMTQAETDIDSNESNIGTLQTNVGTLQTNVGAIESDYLRCITVKTVQTGSINLNADASVNLALDMSTLPSGYRRRAVALGYGGHSKACLTHVFTVSGATTITLYNPSSSAITINLDNTAFYVFYTL